MIQQGDGCRRLEAVTKKLGKPLETPVRPGVSIENDGGDVLAVPAGGLRTKLGVEALDIRDDSATPGDELQAVRIVSRLPGSWSAPD